MVSLKAQGLRRTGGDSSYFQGRFARYGRYQWNIKFYGYESDFEPEMVADAYLGQRIKLKLGGYGFEHLSDLLGRPIEAHLAGRSGGWLVIDSELTDSELSIVDHFVNSFYKSIDAFLKEERKFQMESIESSNF